MAWMGIVPRVTEVIYLDHNATTPVLPEVVEAMMPWLTTHWGNPSSVHGPGRMARRAVEEAREKVADWIGAEPSQVIFTSSATEANNTAIHSALLRQPAKRHIITSAVEHSAVLAYCEYLEVHHRVDVTRLPVDEHGSISLEELNGALRSDTALVSLMWANNETGVIWPVHEIAALCSQRGVPLHTDAVQAVGKIPVRFRDCGAAFLSLSGHKFGSPKGVGALIVANRDEFTPLIFGGKQEDGLRGGTESVANIVAIGVAAKIAQARTVDVWGEVANLRDWFERAVIEQIDGAQVNGKSGERLPNTSNIYLPGMDGDALVTFLDQHGICSSSGSACLESAITPSHVIRAMTGSHGRASESVRISLSHSNSLAEIEAVSKAICEFAVLSA